MKVSSYRMAKSLKEGRDVEDLFCLHLRKKGLVVQKTPVSIDRYDHIDFWIGKSKRGVDVKTMKNRDEVWLELVNTGGNKGWMLGKAYYIAMFFKDSEEFEIFKRTDLLWFINDNIIGEVVTDNRHYHKLYTRSRWNKNDMVFKTTYGNIKHLDHYKLVTRLV